MPPTDDGPSAAALEETFATVGNETRAEILRVLGETPHTPQSFSELRAALGGEIDSGQFNYHLQQLLGQFVERADEGYLLRPEGIVLYRQIRAGTFTSEVSIDPFGLGFDCHFCGTAVEGRYDPGILEMVCPGCDYQYGRARLPPSAIDPDDPRAALPRIDRYLRQEVLALSDRTCPVCVSELDVSFRQAGEVWPEYDGRLDVLVEFGCAHCGNQHYLSVGVALLHESALVSFFDDHGVDLTSVPHWELAFAMTDTALTVESTDPWRVTLSVTRDDETLVLSVDGDLTVVETERVPADG